MTSIPIPLRYTVVSRLFVIQRPTPGQPSARHLPGHLWIYCRHRPGLHGTSSVMVRLCCAGEPASFAISCRYFCFVRALFLPPFSALYSLVFPTFLDPQNALLPQPLYVLSTTYHPKFPYALQYNLNMEREIAPGTILSAGYFGARGNHLPREVEQNPFQPASGHRYNPNLPSPLLAVLHDAHSFYHS